LKTFFLFAILIGNLVLPSKGQDIESIITDSSIRYTVNALSHDSMMGRMTGSKGMFDAAKFIIRRFRDAGLESTKEDEGYFSVYKYYSGGAPVTGINVIGQLPARLKTDTVVIFSAHYDHIGIKKDLLPWEKDSVYNGANDNASGIAALIELAKYYAHAGINNYNLYFIAFSGEELGLIGSKIYVHLKPNFPVKAVINFDMIGRPIDNASDHCMVIADDPRKIIRLLKKAYGEPTRFFTRDAFPNESLNSRSDHHSFKDVTVTAFSFMCTDPHDPYYHEVGDEAGTINFPFLHEAIIKMAKSCIAFIR
jgi:Zn-dependent M28 family amino/carboxypeptidase